MDLLLTMILIVLFTLLVVNVTGNLGPSARSLRRLERRLDVLLDRLGVPDPATAVVPATALAEIDELLAAGRTRNAARAYVEASGADPAEAAVWVRQRAASRAGS